MAERKETTPPPKKKRTEANFRRVDRLLEDALATDYDDPWFGQTVEDVQPKK